MVKADPDKHVKQIRKKNKSRERGVDLDVFIKIISDAYGGDGAISTYADNPEEDHGDGLAQFIFNELMDAVAPKKNPKKLSREQLFEYCNMLDTAKAELNRTRDAAVDVYNRHYGNYYTKRG